VKGIHAEIILCVDIDGSSSNPLPGARQ